MKKCSTCKIDKDESLFSKKRDKLQAVCKECHSIYRKKHYQENRQKYIDKARRNSKTYAEEFYQWLSDKSCFDCGNSDIRVLEFDHLENKEFALSAKIGGRKLESLMDEINKCDIVCSNCHKIRTSVRGNWYKNKFIMQK